MSQGRVSVFLQIPLDNPRKPPLPLCDISCGGWEMSDQSGRYPYLWGVTQQGQVNKLFFFFYKANYYMLHYGFENSQPGNVLKGSHTNLKKNRIVKTLEKLM